MANMKLNYPSPSDYLEKYDIIFYKDNFGTFNVQPGTTTFYCSLKLNGKDIADYKRITVISCGFRSATGYNLPNAQFTFYEDPEFSTLLFEIKSTNVNDNWNIVYNWNKIDTLYPYFLKDGETKATFINYWLNFDITFTGSSDGNYKWDSLSILGYL